MCNFEIGVMVWGVCGIFWVLSNAFIIDERCDPENEWYIFLLGLVITPFYAIIHLFIIYMDHLHEPLFRYRRVFKNDQ